MKTGSQNLMMELKRDNKILVKRSKKRRKTVQIQIKDDEIIVLAPESISNEELNFFIEKAVSNFEKKKSIKNSENYLKERALFLKKKFFVENLPNFELYYSTKMGRGSWGICYSSRGVITLNHKLSTYPEWVLDYVIVHEMAHFIYQDHSRKFWEIVSRYPLKERAIGFLMAKASEIKEN
ncbi:MAG: hypothetical protein CR982_02400 [Candidatus Cloacimonadota bacterium]|nr:MAG: hypothetical protein CR982_02400 [Candidatus Cloacimonadota bacterium]PIE78546.1 MAG: hypothetical protein CSA15_07580 [Candidatus Delongbacteria bacterium]